MVVSEALKIYDDHGEIQEALRSLWIFDHFSSDLFRQLEPCSHIAKFKKGDSILTEGATNETLYFLMSGEVEVLVKGESVARLNETGDMIGEMSVISGSPTSASVVAVSDEVQIFGILTTEIEKLTSESVQNFKNSLYQMYALILAKKLNDTNDKARRFEIANRELNKAKEALQLASSKTLEQVQGQKDAVLRQLQKVFEDKIDPLSEPLMELEIEVEPRFQKTIAKIRTAILESAKVLRPITDQYQSDQGLKAKRLLLAEDNIQDQITAKMALGGTGIKMDIVKDVEGAKSHLSENVYDMVWVNKSLVDLVPVIEEKCPEARIVFMTSGELQEYMKVIQKYPTISNILARHDEDRTFTVKSILTTVSKLNNNDIFGLEKYLNWGVEIQEHTVKCSNERSGLIEEMEAYFKNLGMRKPLIQRCSLASEELLMNAIYDAPVDENGKSLYNHLPRTEIIELEPDQAATFRYATDGQLLAVSVSDPFGTLKRETILDYLQSCYEGNSLNEKLGKGGAGLGLFQMISRSSLVVFNVNPGIKTEVIALINVNLQVQKVTNQPSFHFFTLE